MCFYLVSPNKLLYKANRNYACMHTRMDTTFFLYIFSSLDWLAYYLTFTRSEAVEIATLQSEAAYKP